MKRICYGLHLVTILLVLSSILLASCGGAIQPVSITPTVLPQHTLAIIEQAMLAPSAAPGYLPLVMVPLPTVTRTPTRTPTRSGGGGKNPVGGGHTFPPYSTSLYVTTIDGSTLYNWGCTIGGHDLNTAGAQDSLVILDFGLPKYVDGYYGASLMGYGPVSVDQIAFAVIQFAYGYYTCTGTDFDSHLRIGIGTNNYPSSTNEAVNFNHGEAWANMVNEVNDWIVQHGASGQVDVVGANDIELSWNSYTETKDWLDGYDSANRYDMYNFGAIPGCPSLERIGAQCGSYPYLWSREQVWYVIYGAGPAYPLPEIYLTSGVNAEQWYLMSVYSAEQHGQAVGFVGSLTTYQACKQKGGCGGIDNTPEAGWTQLYDLLNGNSLTAQGLRWASDMKWTSPTTSSLEAAFLEAQQAGGGIVLTFMERSQSDIQALQSSLQSANLSDTLRLGLQDKLQAARWAESIRARGAQYPAPKTPVSAMALATPEPPRQLDGGEKIIEGSEGLIQPAVASIQNLWQGTLEGTTQQVQVLAGAQAENPDQGLLILLLNQPGQGTQEPEFYMAPAGYGSLRIVERQGVDLILQSASGATISFNLVEKSFH